MEFKIVFHEHDYDNVVLWSLETVPRQGEIIHLPYHLISSVGGIRSWYVQEVHHNLDIGSHEVVIFVVSLRKVINKSVKSRRPFAIGARRQ